VQQLHDMNERLFPVKYGDAFYEYVADAPEGYCKLGALWTSERGRRGLCGLMIFLSCSLHR